MRFGAKQIIIGYMCRHLYRRIEKPKHSVIGKHFEDEQNLRP